MGSPSSGLWGAGDTPKAHDAWGSLNKGQHGVMEIPPPEEPAQLSLSVSSHSQGANESLGFPQGIPGIPNHTDVCWNLIPEVGKEARRRSCVQVTPGRKHRTVGRTPLSTS